MSRRSIVGLVALVAFCGLELAAVQSADAQIFRRMLRRNQCCCECQPCCTPAVNTCAAPACNTACNTSCNTGVLPTSDQLSTCACDGMQFQLWHAGRIGCTNSRHHGFLRGLW